MKVGEVIANRDRESVQKDPRDDDFDDEKDEEAEERRLLKNAIARRVKHGKKRSLLRKRLNMEKRDPTAEENDDYEEDEEAEERRLQKNATSRRDDDFDDEKDEEAEERRLLKNAIARRDDDYDEEEAEERRLQKNATSRRDDEDEEQEERRLRRNAIARRKIKGVVGIANRERPESDSVPVGHLASRTDLAGLFMYNPAGTAPIPRAMAGGATIDAGPAITTALLSLCAGVITTESQLRATIEITYQTLHHPTAP
ncbi:hypothetical protein C0Q70_19511 [Pomacea canaliculata]|uniref:Uncharacterized protein n=1 Tax=Pomacea canaliculata TaxID=400727 RepID=A0A2T7NJK4_POMCA|nr:hypothetical protein C0Q70_19511 [Pomacea canaliculata]